MSKDHNLYPSITPQLLIKASVALKSLLANAQMLAFTYFALRHSAQALYSRMRIISEKKTNSKKDIRTPEEIKSWLSSNFEAFGTQVGAKRKDFAAVKNIPDAGERYSALKTLERALAPIKHDTIAKLAESLSRRPEKMAKAAYGAVAVVLLPLFGIGIPFYLDARREAAIDGRKNRENKLQVAAHETEFFKPLDELKQEVAQLQGTTLKDNMRGIVLSPRFDDLYDAFPEVKHAFVRATAKQQARDIAALKLHKPELKAAEVLPEAPKH